jgi:hypothetical protein
VQFDGAKSFCLNAFDPPKLLPANYYKTEKFYPDSLGVNNQVSEHSRSKNYISQKLNKILSKNKNIIKFTKFSFMEEKKP